MHVGIGNRETLQEIITRAAKDAELTSPISILSIIYTRMDADFQQHLPKIEKVGTTAMAPTSKQAYIQRMGRNGIRRKVTNAIPHCHPHKHTDPYVRRHPVTISYRLGT